MIGWKEIITAIYMIGFSVKLFIDPFFLIAPHTYYFIYIITELLSSPIIKYVFV